MKLSGRKAETQSGNTFKPCSFLHAESRGRLAMPLQTSIEQLVSIAARFEEKSDKAARQPTRASSCAAEADAIGDVAGQRLAQCSTTSTASTCATRASYRCSMPAPPLARTAAVRNRDL